MVFCFFKPQTLNSYKYLVQKDEFRTEKKTMQTCGLSEAFKTDGGHTLQMENKIQRKKNAVFTVKTDKTKQQVQKKIKNQT